MTLKAIGIRTFYRLPLLNLKLGLTLDDLMKVSPLPMCRHISNDTPATLPHVCGRHPRQGITCAVCAEHHIRSGCGLDSTKCFSCAAPTISTPGFSKVSMKRWRRFMSAELRTAVTDYLVVDSMDLCGRCELLIGGQP